MLINVTQNIKKKWFHVKVECLVVEEQFCQQAEILAVNFEVLAVHFEHTERSLAVDFFAGRLSAGALTHVVSVGLLQLHVLQTKLADIELALLSVLLRIRTEVPRVNFIFPKLDSVDVFDFGYGLVLFLQGGGGWIHFFISLLNMVDFVVAALLISSHLSTKLAVN
jgi:hypothetical protein